MVNLVLFFALLVIVLSDSYISGAVICRTPVSATPVSKLPDRYTYFRILAPAIKIAVFLFVGYRLDKTPLWAMITFLILYALLFINAVNDLDDLFKEHQ